MAIDDKATAQWTEEDLSELCDQNRRESARLEFKSELGLGTDREKLEAERDVQGMANSGGGHIIYGIAEAALEDGSQAASHLTPLQDGTLYERLNNVLDSRGEPRLPFEIHSIGAAAEGSYLVVEIFGHHRPHRSSDGRFCVRRNILVRQMTEGEIGEAYRDRFIRQAAALSIPEGVPEPGPADEARREQRQRLSREFALYRAETGATADPGWLSVLAIPLDAEDPLIDPLRIEPVELWEASERVDGRWRPEEAPLTHFNLRRTTRGFYGQLPDRDDTYPRYLVRFWRSGVSEYGDLLEPMFPEDEPQRLVPSAAIVEYTHDFLLLTQQVYRFMGYGGVVEAEARLENVAGYRLGVRPGFDLPNLRPIEEHVLAPDPWRGPVDQLGQGAAEVAHRLADLTFLAAGAGRPYFFRNGEYVRR